MGTCIYLNRLNLKEVKLNVHLCQLSYAKTYHKSNDCPQRVKMYKKSFLSFYFFSVYFFPSFFSLVFILSFISFVLSGVPWPSPCPSPSSRPPSRYQSGPNSLPPRAATPTRPPSRPPSRPSRPPSHPSAHGSPAPVSTMPKRMSSEGTIPQFVHVFVCLCSTPMWVYSYKSFLFII